MSVRYVSLIPGEGQPLRCSVNGRVKALCLSLLTAPLVIVVADVVGAWAHHPLIDPAPGPWFWQHVLLLVGTALLLPSTVVLLRLVPQRGGCLGWAGVLLASVGVLANTAIVTLDFVAEELAQSGSRAEMRHLYVQTLDNPALSALDTLQSALPLGIALLALALLLARSVPRSAALALLVAAVFSNPALGLPLRVAGRAALFAGFATAATRVVETVKADPPRPEQTQTTQG